MRPPRLPWLACSVAVCLALLTATPATLAQDADEAAVCGVLTADEVGQALGTAVGTGIGWTYEGYATCNWIATDPASFAYADAEWQDVALEQIVGGVPGGVELTVGGQPAYLAPDIGALFIRLDAGLLTLSMEAASPDIDVQAALTALGEAAVPRADSLPEPVPSGSDFEPPVVPETDPVSEAFCALFTPEEVGSILGTEVEAAGSFESCTWTSTALDGSFSSATAGWVTGTLEDQRNIWTDGRDLTIAGRPAYVAADAGALFLDTGHGIVMLTAFGFGADGSDLDAEAALRALGELGVARSASLPPPPTPQPVPSFNADANLEALFPDSVGGQPLEVQSMAGVGAFGNSEADLLARIEEMLAAQGKTLDDVSVAFVFGADHAILAFKVAGGDPSAFGNLLLESFGTEVTTTDQEPGQVAGKDVTIVTAGGQTSYIYSSGEVLWLVGAEEPQLTEILTALP